MLKLKKLIQEIAMKTKHLFVLWAVFICHYLNAAGQTWNNVTNYDAICVALSADGCKLAACVSTVAAMISSTDAGQTWHTNQTPGNWPFVGIMAMASSADGTKLVANGTYDDKMYISTNSGSNWTATASLADNWAQSVCTSALGNILAAATWNGLIYISTNSGLAWTSNTAPKKSWTAIASSVDGTKLAAAASGDRIYVSTNFGTTWTMTQSAVDSWSSVACNADGTKLIASGSATYISTNFGAHWTRATTNTGYVASSADGTKLIIAGRSGGFSDGVHIGGPIYTSGNSGATWVSNNAPTGWYAIASSADGSEWFGTTDNGGLWIGRTTPSPQLNVRPAASNLMLSWLVPSTNFVVQQNSSLTTTKWVTLTNVPVFDAATLSNQLALPNTGQGFFRLITQ
jgi:hypothetical protein